MIYFYLANFLTVLLRPQYSEPVDTAQQVLDRGLVPFVFGGGGYMMHLLLSSPLPVLQELGNKTIVPDNREHFMTLVEKVLGERTHVLLGNFNRNDGSYHISRDTVPGTIPYGGYIMNKKWQYAEEYDLTLLIIHQV